eukprot:COSAG01_NODE_4201_length_5247_cov_4.674048_2_plen_170_part_00
MVTSRCCVVCLPRTPSTQPSRIWKGRRRLRQWRRLGETAAAFTRQLCHPGRAASWAQGLRAQAADPHTCTCRWRECSGQDSGRVHNRSRATDISSVNTPRPREKRVDMEVDHLLACRPALVGLTWRGLIPSGCAQLQPHACAQRPSRRGSAAGSHMLFVLAPQPHAILS